MKVDLLLTNARVRSGAALEHCSLCALAIGNGRIQACIPVAESDAWQAERRIDLEGALVLPGFVDTHTHLGWAGQALWDVNWLDVTTRSGALERVRLAASRIEPGFWLLGGTWSRGKVPDAELPTLTELDALTGDNPLYLISEDQSLALANSRALALFQLPPTRDYEATRETGRLEGVFARSRVSAGVVPPRDHYRQRAELRAAVNTLTQHGITEAHDIATYPDPGPTPLIYEERSFTDITLFDELAARGELATRIAVRPSLKRWQEAAADVAHRDSPGLVTCRGVKLLLDSSLYSRPFPGGRYSYRYPGYTTALGWMQAADRAGLQVSVHALGDLGVHETLDLFQEVQADCPEWPRRQRLIHGIRIAPEDIQRIARLGIVVEAQPWDLVDDPHSLTRVFDEEFLATAYPFRSLIDAGAHVIFGSDWRMPHRADQIDLDPLVGIHIAATRSLPETRDEVLQPRQCIRIAEAVHCYTREPAFAQGAEDRRGAVAPGMDADLVVLSRDIIANSPEALFDTRVLLTLVAGRIVYSRTNL